MKAQKSDAGSGLKVPAGERVVFQPVFHPARVRRAFTLIELLVVISILGILAALSVPAFKGLGRSQTQISAARQILDDLARARQLAISHRTAVCMAFVPPNFWNFTTNRTDQALNLLDKQLMGYAFIAMRTAGDQPGRGVIRYLSDWKFLPDGSLIALPKFSPPTQYYYINSFDPNTPIFGFSQTQMPFPTAQSGALTVPYVGFNYMGQLTDDGVNLAARDAYIPLAQGLVSYARDPATRKPYIPAQPLTVSDIQENPPGNSTNSMYHIIRIDRLTGRATLLQQKVP